MTAEEVPLPAAPIPEEWEPYLRAARPTDDNDVVFTERQVARMTYILGAVLDRGPSFEEALEQLRDRQQQPARSGAVGPGDGGQQVVEDGRALAGRGVGRAVDHLDVVNRAALRVGGHDEECVLAVGGGAHQGVQVVGGLAGSAKAGAAGDSDHAVSLGTLPCGSSARSTGLIW